MEARGVEMGLGADVMMMAEMYAGSQIGVGGNIGYLHDIEKNAAASRGQYVSRHVNDGYWDRRAQRQTRE